jgi:hypothetical protein
LLKELNGLQKLARIIFWFFVIFLVKIQGYYFAFGSYDAMLLIITDFIRCRLSGYSVMGDSHFQAGCRLVFKMKLYKSTQEDEFLFVTIT